MLTGLVVVILTSCAINGPETDTFCAIAHPIYISKNDVLTEKTLIAIIKLNEKGEELCGWKAPK